MFLSKIAPNVHSRAFRRDYADVHDMHRTLMSAFPDTPGEVAARQHNGVLWRLDGDGRNFTLYVQSHTRPDWTTLPEGYLATRAQVRCLQPALAAIQPGRKLAFRLLANPTRSTPPQGEEPGRRGRGKRSALHTPEEQIAWLIRQGERHGFVIPATGGQGPDVALAPSPPRVGYKRNDDQRKRSNDRLKITVAPVRFDGHLVITDADAFAAALKDGVGRAKAYGCGLLSLAPPQVSE